MKIQIKVRTIRRSKEFSCVTLSILIFILILTYYELNSIVGMNGAASGPIGNVSVIQGSANLFSFVCNHIFEFKFGFELAPRNVNRGM